MDSTQQDLLAQFCAITGADATSARTALESVSWDLSQAVELYFEEQGGRADTGPSGASSSGAEPTASQPGPAPASSAAPASSSSSSASRRAPQNNSRLRTLQDLQPSAQDDEDEDDKDQDLFAGGEKSGLAVQNPGSGGRPTDHFRNILNQARQNRERPPSLEDEDEPTVRGNFSGRAQTLGGDDAPSRIVQDPHAALHGSRPRLETIQRVLHLWRDGVSVDDGPLFRFDDPANEHIMTQINRGQAPLSLLDVQPNQEVDLTLEPHKDQDYVAPKKKYKPFSGQGQRLGSPVPGTEAVTSTPSTTTAATSAATANPATGITTVDIDDSAPTVSLQIRLGDGTRLSSRFNTTHTLGDLYAFVDRAQANQRPYALLTTFPSKELTDRAQTLGDHPDLKRGGVVVQKWT